MSLLTLAPPTELDMLNEMAKLDLVIAEFKRKCMLTLRRDTLRHEYWNRQYEGR